MSSLDKTVRADFPVLRREVNGRPLTYLDSASTAQKPRQVIEAISDYYALYCGNIRRGAHALTEESTTAYEAAREAVAGFVGAPDRQGVIFTRSFTEAANLVAMGWGQNRLGEGDEVLVTELEHHSNLVPWQVLCRRTGAALRYATVDPGQGSLDAATVCAQIGERTRLVAVSGMSNVLGCRVDLTPIIAAAHAVGARVFVDAAQLVVHDELDIAQLAADFVGFSGHKLHGPTGIGVLVCAPAALAELEPVLTGGEMVGQVTMESATWTDPPWRFEGGTPPIAQAIGLGVAVRYLGEIGVEARRAHERRIIGRLVPALDRIEGVIRYGLPDPAGHGAVVSFNILRSTDNPRDIVNPHDVAVFLDEVGVAIRAGDLCAQPLMARYGISGMCRASGALYTSATDIDALEDGLEEAVNFFTKRGG